MILFNNNNFVDTSTQNKTLKKEILEVLPLNLRNIMIRLPADCIADMEEIRLRINKPLIINVKNNDYFINEQGELTSSMFKCYVVTKPDIEKTYQLITNYSVYALEEEIRNGFITIKGGHRVGICGRTILQGSHVKTIKDISGLNIRVSKQKIGVSNRYMHYLIAPSNSFYNTLIVSPPQCGKTTLLRDIIRNLSNGMKNPYFAGFKVGIVDERSEICGIYQGIPQNDIGIRSDILDACPKAEGIMMLIRSMSPQIIATDEIGKKEDIDAIEEALNAGIKLITTVHGKNIEEINRRPYLNRLIQQGIFERIFILSNQPKVGTVSRIINGTNNEIIIAHPTNKGRDQSVG